jgi:hypothetical protein
MSRRRFLILLAVAYVPLLLGLTWMLWPRTGRSADDAAGCRGPDCLRVRFITKPENLGVIAQSARAIVFVDYPVSVPARLNCERHLGGIALLQKQHAALNLDFYIVDHVGDDWTVDWIAGLNDPRLEEEATAGNGLILWLEHGKVLRMLAGHEIERTPRRIETLTLEVWARAWWGWRA